MVLASSSPQRKKLLTEMGYEFDVVSPDIDETPRVGEVAPDLVVRLAKSKAAAVLKKLEGDVVVVGADSVVAVGSEILGKPKDVHEAREMLNLLSGARHSVFTGYCLATKTETVSGFDEAQLWFHQISSEQLDKYLDTGDWAGKAGACSLQGESKGFVQRIEGEESTIVGLPTNLVSQALNDLGQLK